jgi:hypothetical protein
MTAAAKILRISGGAKARADVDGADVHRRGP